MEINNYGIVAISLFLLIIYSVILINTYEKAIDTLGTRKKITLTEEEFFKLIDVNITIPPEKPSSSQEKNKTNFLKNPLSEEKNTNESLDKWNRTQFGPIGWTMIHVTAANYPEEPTFDDIAKYKLFLKLLGYFLPCKECGRHFLKMLGDVPLEVYDREGIMNYTCDLHNRVNKRLKKPIFDCDKYKEKWGGERGQCGCGDDNSTNTNSTNKSGSDHDNHGFI